MEEKAKVPPIRFKGFNDDWEQRELSEILDRRQIIQKISNEAPRLAFASGQGVIPLSERRTNNRDQLISDETAKRYLLTEFNDIVYNPANLKYGAIDRNKYGKGVISPIYVTFTTQEIPSFVERIVTTEKFKLKALQFEEGTVVKRQSVSPGNLLSFKEMISPSKEEQQKIGDYFDVLESLITLHQLKHLKLKNVKKVMLEKMFPKNGSKVPEIRFAGFTDAWEQCKLNEVVDIVMGQSPDGSTYTDIPSDYILVQGNADLKDGWVYPRIWTTQITKKAEAGDLIMSVRAPAGEMGKTAYNAVIGRGVAAIKGNEFIFQSLLKMNDDGYWKKLSSGSTFDSLNSDNIKNAELSIPTQEEQEKIGEYLIKIDNLITLHQRKLEKLKNIKKACLEKMFV